MHACAQCMHAYSVCFSLSHMHTHQNSFMIYSSLLHVVHAVPKQKGPDVFPFLSPVRGTNLWRRSGYMIWLRPGSSNICTTRISVCLNLLGVLDTWGFPYRVLQYVPESLDHCRKFDFSATSNLPALVLAVPIL